MTAPSPGPGLPREWFFTPGPTQLHPLVPGALAGAVEAGLPSESHRGPAFRREMERTVEALRALLGVPEGHRILFVGSASEAMERIVQGAVARRSLHLVNGAFARRFHTVARALGREPDAVEVPDGEGYDLAELAVPDDVELLALTQNETSTGAALDPGGIGEVGRRRPGLLLAVDAVTATPTAPLELEGVDAFFFSVQKLFGLPAGLGVLVASPRLVERSRELRDRGIPVGGYMHLPALAKRADGNETVATPNALAVHLLGTVAGAYAERGLERIRREAADGARRVEAAAAAAGWIPFVEREAHRSRTVLVFRVPDGSAGPIRSLAERGFRVGPGYGPYREAHIRVANFPVHPPEAVQALAGAIRSL